MARFWIQILNWTRFRIQIFLYFWAFQTTFLRFIFQTCRDSGFKIEIDAIQDSDLGLQVPIICLFVHLYIRSAYNFFSPFFLHWVGHLSFLQWLCPTLFSFCPMFRGEGGLLHLTLSVVQQLLNIKFGVSGPYSWSSISYTIGLWKIQALQFWTV